MLRFCYWRPEVLGETNNFYEEKYSWLQGITGTRTVRSITGPTGPTGECGATGATGPDRKSVV